jgi:outer membrane protein assembly factor BamD
VGARVRLEVKVLLNSKPARVALVATACVLALSACGSNKKNKPRLAYEERPVELLYATGANRLDRRMWNQAVDYFQEVERQHPYSEWSRRSILMQAYAHYESNDYSEAIADADRFIQLYPGNPTAAYAHYIKAICYFEQIVDVNRDQAATGQALEALRDVVQRYPRTEYASDARLKIDMVNDQLAGKEMTIGRWYLRNGDTLAAVNRFKTVVDRYQTTSHAPEALYRLVESYLTLGLIEEAKRNGAVLGYNYPGDPWYADAYKLLTSKGLRPAVEPKAGGKRGLLRLPFRRNKSDTVAPPKAPESNSAVEASKATKKRTILKLPFGGGDKKSGSGSDAGATEPAPAEPKAN